MKKISLLITLSSFIIIQACTPASTELECGQVSSEIQKRLKADVSHLASDELEGREAGTAGAQKAADFIAARFKELNLKPLGDDNSYLQSFQFTDKVQSEVSLSLGKHQYSKSEHLFASQFSASSKVEKLELLRVNYGIEAPEINYNDYADLEDLQGKAFVMDISSPDGIHPHSAYAAHHDLKTRIIKAQHKGAHAVILVNEGDMASNPLSDFKKLRNDEINIPVVFVAGDALQHLQNGTELSLSVEVNEVQKVANNVVALLDNKANYTVVIGAHFDHLGYGASGSLYRGEPAIHNGADDNASGTAGMLELARYYTKQKDEKVNYLFIAFSAEEKGLLGSNYFVKNSPIPTEDMAYMINMDMIGRLDSNTLVVNGVGTAPRFAGLDSLNCAGLKLILKESGSGPSDHTSFYLKDVPVLRLFTGSHEDYHKPSDDVEKVNFSGMEKVLSFVLNFNKAYADGTDPVFQKTTEKDQGKAPRFSVTLGVVPDYLFDGKGMRIDGINEGKPAAKAGLKAGDVVVQMDEHEVVDMMSYMEGLSKYKKGDSCTVMVKRKGKELSFDVTF